MKRFEFAAAAAALVGALTIGGAAEAAVLSFSGNICTTTGADTVACQFGNYVRQDYGDVSGQLNVVYDGDIGDSNAPGTLFAGLKNGGTLYGSPALPGPGYGGGTAEILFQGLAGSSVTITGFSVGAYAAVASAQSRIVITDLLNNVLFDSGAITVPYVGGSLFSNLSGVSAQGLRLRWDTSNSNVAIDNIAFSVTQVPLPAAAPLLAAGFAGLMFAARRRKSA